MHEVKGAVHQGQSSSRQMLHSDYCAYHSSRERTTLWTISTEWQSLQSYLLNSPEREILRSEHEHLSHRMASKALKSRQNRQIRHLTEANRVLQRLLFSSFQALAHIAASVSLGSRLPFATVGPKVRNRPFVSTRAGLNREDAAKRKIAASSPFRK